MSSRRSIYFLFACALLGWAMASTLGFSWTSRLSTHEGFYQVTVADASPDTGPRPRQTVVVVMDGLGYREARGMRSLARLGELGQCRKTYVGGLSMSRPVYAVISTGLEQDRTGARNNDEESPLLAQSLWELAQKAGLSVSGTSELTWWRELFPRGFSVYLTPPRSSNYFELSPPAELRLIHHIYIDESGHDFGAAAKQYHAMVQRADDELAAFLPTLDLSRDLIVVTADHGHSQTGGHGGVQDRVANVLTCYAGLGVRPQSAPPPMLSTSIAPSLSLLLHLPFPAQMRAGSGIGNGHHEDGLDVLEQLVDPTVFSADYLSARRQSVDKFREQNRQQLLQWLPESDGTWSAFYDWHHRHRGRPLILAPILFGLILYWRARRGPGVLTSVAFVAMVYTATYGMQVLLRGSFDMTSIDHRRGFIQFTLLLSSVIMIGSILLHVFLRRNYAVLLLDLCMLVLTSEAAYLLHPLVLGFRLGFPLPDPRWIFFPYFMTLFLFVACLASLCCGVIGLLRKDAIRDPRPQAMARTSARQRRVPAP